MKSSRDVLIQTKKMDVAANFYENVMGFKVFKRNEHIIGFETGSFRLFLDKGEPYGPVFEFITPHFEETKHKLMKAGCRVEEEDPKIPRCYLRDPFGIIFNLAEEPH
jgi:catechol 2,3-dioxygenase-like lactoylglutathione lyase family enzyme